MAKKVLVIIGLCILAGYLVFAAFYFEKKPREQICSSFEIVSEDKRGTHLADITEIEKTIDSKGLNPYGKPLKEIDTYEIEQAIISHQMIKSAEVFITNNGGIKAVIKNRKPVLRVITVSGENYYIDNEGERMPLSESFIADLPLATGSIKEDFAKTELLEFAVFLGSNKFWNSQIEQIVVMPDNELKLIPKIGDHQIILGKLDNYDEKLSKLKTFYQKGLSETGWNKYSEINLKYDKQVVCTKR